MGTVIDFPSRDAASRYAAIKSRRDASSEHSGRVVILPVIRIERYDEAPAGLFTPRGGEQGRKRRRRASRS